MITERDIREQVARTVDAQGELGEGIDVDGITAEIVQTYGLVAVETIGGASFGRLSAGTTPRSRPDPMAGQRTIRGERRDWNRVPVSPPNRYVPRVRGREAGTGQAEGDAAAAVVA